MSIKKNDLPAMPFYVGDWLKCPEVRALMPDIRGLWFDMLCYLWESSERGVMVKPNGIPYTDNEIIRIIGLDNQNSGNWLTTILENGVCSRRETDGAIYSRRMVRDEEIRKIRAESGKKGGNPKLINKDLDNQMVNQKDNQNTESEIENENTSLCYYDYKKLEVELLNSAEWKNQVCRIYNTDVSTVDKLITEFCLLQEASGTMGRAFGDFRRHFINWMKTANKNAQKKNRPMVPR